MDQEFPPLVNPEDKCPYVIISIQEDILKSKLLTSAQVCEKDPQTLNREKLLPIEVFLKELTQKSPLSYTPSADSLQLAKNYNTLKQEFEKRLNQQQQQFKTLGSDMSKGYVSTCDSIVNKLQSSLSNESTSIQNVYEALNSVLKSDPEQEASVPKPSEISSKIKELRAAPELPDYLFTTAKKLRAWKDAPASLCQWNNTKEKFYSQALDNKLKAQFQNRSQVALKFWNQQIEKIGQQMLNIIQDDAINTQELVDLEINDAKTFALLLNTMITSDTRIILNINNYTNEDSQSIAQSLTNLSDIQNLQIKWNTVTKCSGLSHISKAIAQMKQLVRLQFVFNDATVANNHAKDFFSEFKDAEFPNLREVFVSAIKSDVNASITQIANGLEAIGNENVQIVEYIFSQSQLDEKAAIALGESLNKYKNIKKLVLNFSGYSLKSNSIKDKGFEGLVQHVPKFSDSLVHFTLNVARNHISDKGVAVLKKLFQSVQWISLKQIDFAFHYNHISETGVKKLGKLLNTLQILVEAELNLNSTQCNAAGLSFLINNLGAQVQASINVRQTEVNKVEGEELKGKIYQLTI